MKKIKKQERDEMYQYDVALSFAGADREYVEDVATFLKSYGVKVFYDKFEQANLWGKNLYNHLSDVYKKKAKYTIMFISKAYAESLWTNHERKSAQSRAFKESQEYILPVKFDDTEITGLDETVAYLDATNYSAKEVSKFFLEKSGFNIKKRWWGKWERESVTDSFNGDLFIYDVNEKGFYFELIVQHGAHTGWLEKEYAQFISHNEALFVGEKDFDNKPCHITFYKINETIQVVENNCLHYHGMRAYLDGDYHLNKDIFCYYDELIDDKILSEIYSLLGNKYWKNFKKCFNDTFDIDNIDKFEATVIGGGMAGFYTIYEAIIMIGNNNKIWGAFLDVNKVYYFTSEKEYKNMLPKTIDNWRENFKEKEVIFLIEKVIDENLENKENKLLNEFVKFIHKKQENGEDIDISDDELEDFFLRCINDEEL